jgi:hypothetical protein
MSQLYKKAIRLQSELDSMEPDSAEQGIVKTYGLQRINSEWTPHKRAIRSSRAYFIPDGFTQFDDDTVEFDETLVTAEVPSLSIAKLGIRQVIALRCFEPVVLGPATSIEADLVDLDMDLSNATTTLPLHQHIRRPIYIPVEDVTFITLVA